jgi:hypothetical protein
MGTLTEKTTAKKENKKAFQALCFGRLFTNG